MLKKTKVVGCVLLAIGLASSVHLHSTVHATIGSCSVTVPSSVSPGSNQSLIVNVSNTSSSAIQYINIGVPVGNLFYTSNSISDWSVGNPGDGSGIVLNGKSLAPGQNEDFQIFANTAISNEPASNWSIKVSDDPDGADQTACTGNLSTSISGHPPNSNDNGVSGLVVTNLTSSSATLSWNSNADSTSLVYYGKNPNYSSWSNHIKNPTSNHVINLTGLSPNTTYHFQVAGQDDSLNPYYSADSTFITLPGSQSPASTFISTPIPIKSTPSEKKPPTIKLSTIIKNPYKQAPILNGVAEDNETVAAIEYSTDGGKNWLPVDKTIGLGGKKATFSFIPQIINDDNYSIALRAIDTSGNTAQTVTTTLVIDRLPPLVGGTLVSVGPQILEPGSNGDIKTIVGVDQKITLSAVGGATKITLDTSGDTNGKPKSFVLRQSQDTGLWSGILSFTKPGIYSLTANSEDGAGNKVSRKLNTIEVAPAAKVIKADSSKAIDAAVTAYYLQPGSSDWVVWDGGAYGQDNPQKTGASGQFSLFLPAGKYYLNSTAKGYRNQNSQIFELKVPAPVSINLTMQPAGLKLGRFSISLPQFSTQKVSFNAGSKSTTNLLMDKNAPDFNLAKIGGGRVNSVDYLGKPTVLSFMSTWSPASAEQLHALSKLQASKDVNVVPIGLQENAGKLKAFQSIAGYDLNWLVDPDSQMSDAFKVTNLPSHYFVDRDGVIKKIMTGVLTSDEMLSYLSAL